MHFVIDYKNGEKPSIYEQLNIISRSFNKETKNVLELGCGQCSNIGYLAKKVEILIFMVLLFIYQKRKKRKKTILYGDYHDLSQFPSNNKIEKITEI